MHLYVSKVVSVHLYNISKNCLFISFKAVVKVLFFFFFKLINNTFTDKDRYFMNKSCIHETFLEKSIEKRILVYK